MRKISSVLTVAAVVASLATAFAQTPGPEAGPAPTPAPNPEITMPPPAPSSAMGEEKKPEKPMKGKHGKAKAHGKSSEKKRGLDRADEAAGEHGKQGRGQARAQR